MTFLIFLAIYPVLDKGFGFGKMGSFPAILIYTVLALGLNIVVGFAGLLELPGGILMMLGLFTRPATFILSGQMAVAYWARWAPRGFWRSLIVGEASIYFCFAYLLMAAIGGGPWSLDSILARSRKRRKDVIPAGELVGTSRS